jgi:hypothetical protein
MPSNDIKTIELKCSAAYRAVMTRCKSVYAPELCKQSYDYFVEAHKELQDTRIKMANTNIQIYNNILTIVY